MDDIGRIHMYCVDDRDGIAVSRTFPYTAFICQNIHSNRTYLNMWHLKWR